MLTTTLTQDQIQARLQLVDEHIRAENAHDVDGIMKTFGNDPTFLLNGDTFVGHESIRGLYQGFGFGGAGGFDHIHVEETRRHVSDDGHHRRGNSPSLFALCFLLTTTERSPEKGCIWTERCY